MTMGEKIKQLRIDAEMTQEELGKILGVQKSAIRKYEKGEVTNIKRSTIKKLAETFNISPAELMCFDDKYDSDELSKDVIRCDDFSQRDERDIAKLLSFANEQLTNYQEALMFDGEPMDDESRELISIALENSIRMAKKLAKEKYTPKKYKN